MVSEIWNRTESCNGWVEISKYCVRVDTHWAVILKEKCIHLFGSIIFCTLYKFIGVWKRISMQWTSEWTNPLWRLLYRNIDGIIIYYLTSGKKLSGNLSHYEVNILYSNWFHLKCRVKRLLMFTNWVLMQLWQIDL